MKRIGKYLSVRSIEQQNGRKTKIWQVVNNHGEELGMIKWYGPWRQYTFDPEPGTTFNHGCLVGIANFIEDSNKRQRTMSGRRQAAVRP